MKTMKPKDVIKSVLIDELGTMIKEHPYISFIIMASGIEFLGKCLSKEDWQKSGQSRQDFQEAIRQIPSFSRYRELLDTHQLYESFRCGLVHAISPKMNVTLSSKGEQHHLTSNGGRINLRVEDFYDDFRRACEFIIEKNFAEKDKMNVDFLVIPEICEDFDRIERKPDGQSNQKLDIGASGVYIPPTLF